MNFTKPKRPINECGLNNSFKWYTDNNDLTIDGRELENFYSFLTNNGFKDFITITSTNYVDVKDVIKWLALSGNDYVAMFLVWAELPEMVENIVVNYFKGVLREKGLLQDKLKLKLAKLR